MPRTELFLFESAYGRDAFRARVGQARAPTRVVHNGVGPGEFEPVLPDGDASDLLYIGELRRLKGVDVLVEALAALHAHGRKVTLTFVGAGPDAETLRARVAELGLHGFVRFAGVLAARAAFTRGRLLIVPSRAESLPYVVLEAAAASVPMIATNVGGIPEIFGPQAAALIPPGRPDLLAGSIEAALDDFDAARARAATLRERVAEWFSAPAMVAGVLAGYRDALSLNPHFLGSG